MKIILTGESILRLQAQDVSIQDIKQGLYVGLVLEMQGLLNACNDGVALAAPQIGKSLRLFVISPKVFDTEQKSENRKPNLVYFNPVIKKLSVLKKDLDEGCLSVNGLYGKVTRSNKALIEAYDEHGRKFTRGASGLLAQIFQHEVDHLNGVLYTDTATNLQKLESRKTNV